jgi:pantoate--beta-alanine ligase
MIIFKYADQLRQHIDQNRRNGEKIGFVPTMGALHDGHLSLLKKSKEETSLSVVSIFVNPTQFNDPKDFEKYPVTVDQDIYKLEAAGCNLLFIPGINEIYPEAAARKKQFDLGYLDQIMEAKFRPGHYNGVCMVVEKLLNIVQPDHLYLGQKDFQQCMVIKKLVEIMGVDKKINIRICPTVREEDGLAMSSRNLRLKPEERTKATTIYRTLVFVKENLNKYPLADLKQKAIQKLEEQDFKVDYVEIADASTLKPLNEWDSKHHCVILAAAYLNEVRLIDNLVLER